ncbi:MAG: hypothetical protein OHK0013_21080 [Sandaracinaceae bacterium]
MPSPSPSVVRRALVASALVATWVALGTVRDTYGSLVPEHERPTEAAPTPPPVLGSPLVVRLAAPPGRPLLGTLWLETDDGARVHEASVEGSEVILPAVAPGPYVIRARVAGFARAARAVRTPCDPVVLTLEPIARVAGRVVGVDGAPSPAQVRIVGSGIWPARVVEADAEGRFVFEDVPAGVYEVEATSGTQISEPRRGLTVDPEASIFLSFQLTEGASVEGTVVDARTGRPLAGAEVTVAAAPVAASPRSAVTGADGRFVLRPFPPGTAYADVRAPGFVPAVAIACRTGSSCRIALAEGASLRGRVVDTERRPIANAWVEVLGEARDRSPIAVTSTVAPIASLLFASSASAANPVTPSSPTEGPMPTIVGAGLGVTAEVPPLPLVPSTEPAVDDLPMGSAPARARTSLRTDAFGEFVVTGLPPGRVEVLARAPGFQVGRSARLSVSAGLEREGLEIVLRPGATLRARVLDEHGRPADARVEVRAEGDPVPRYVETDARGELVVEDLGGVVLLAITATGYPLLEQIVDVSDGQDVTRTFHLETPTHVVRARVRDAQGNPVPDALVRIESLRPGTGQPRTLVTDDNGEVELSPAPHGAVLLTASHPSYVASAPVVAEATRTGTAGFAELRLETPLSIVTSVLDAWTGAAIRGAIARFACLETAPCVRETESDEDGALALWSVRAGRYRMEVRAPGYAPAISEVAVRAPRRGSEIEIDPVVLTPTLTLEGDVVDVLGRTIEGATVSSGDEEREAVRATTDAEGHFVLSGLVPGRHEIAVEHPAAGTVRLPVMVRRDRDPAPVIARLPQRADREASSPDLAAVVGVGVAVGEENGAVVIRRVLSRSAAGAGLLRGDVVTEVDGVAVHDAASARARLTGPALLPALVRLRREGRDFYVRVARERHVPDGGASSDSR